MVKSSFRLIQGEHHRIGSLRLGIQFPLLGGAAVKGDGCSTRGIYVGGDLCYLESGGGCSRCSKAVHESVWFPGASACLHGSLAGLRRPTGSGYRVDGTVDPVMT